MEKHICPYCESTNTQSIEQAYINSHYHYYETHNRPYTYEYTIDDKKYIETKYRKVTVGYICITELAEKFSLLPPPKPGLKEMEKEYKEMDVSGDVKKFGCLSIFVCPIALLIISLFFPSLEEALPRIMDDSTKNLFFYLVALVVVGIVLWEIYVHGYGNPSIRKSNEKIRKENEKKVNDYAHALNEWRKGYICMRCGNVFYENLDDPDREPK